MYKNFQIGKKTQEYKGTSEAVVVSRSAQRLALLVPVDYIKENDSDMQSQDNEDA